MTIIAYGSVIRIEQSHNPRMKERLVISMEAGRNVGDSREFAIDADKGEADAYRPGTAVELRIIPTTTPR